MVKIIPIVLSGGKGLRLWPLSRKQLPKQFIKIPFDAKNTLFQTTILDFKSPIYDSPIIIGSVENRFLIKEQLDEIRVKPKEIILEPQSKNTAAPVCIAAIQCLRKYNNALMLVLPSDHYFPKRKIYFNSDFFKSLNTNFSHHTIFGLKTTSPNKELGYIKEKIIKNSKFLTGVEQFFEKPNLEKARKFHKDNKFYFNSGMFFLKPSKILNEFKKIDFNFYINAERSVDGSYKDLGFTFLKKVFFNKIRSISFDYLILEKIKNLYLLKIDHNWSDLGSWESIIKIMDKDKSNNYIYAKKIEKKNVSNSLLISDKEFNVLSSIDDLLIVNIDNALLVSSREKSHKIKEILKRKKSEDFQYGQIDYRPWGNFKIIEKGSQYIVKKLTIKPGARISSQKHMHRSEHWTVVNGKAKVIKNEKNIILEKNESIYIPKNTKHCIFNPYKKKLEIIETQIGDIISEDDIIRFEDPYKR